ncbi:putative polypeptide deformylase [Actinoplanes missouriensis 431]|uniref:Peptide deformylase n=1 Tax=Actinoplanes missouriensis (strain ATCC 14538 / DSM 43046 / CBS 188.64 / JCM 3121 / NBRC 102363 / NCIMB 12654 / NRRL B-3342 / UNCC 431) TaxID=512565 RepID=I0H8S9_ACTM4|nr:peptide deformylase [Actinoplanes missouriensis]BAL89416.1 putative polypeptide deformylase [Actinoplanes missouriensis 431]
MTVRPIRIFGDPVLRTPADPVTSFDAELRALVRDLEDSVREPGRAGVAGPQIGVSLRVFSYNVGGVVGHMVNPVLSDFDGTQTEEEGCLSLPGLGFETTRAMRVTATGFDLNGEPLVIHGEGFLARALQHETDHLDGRLYVDTLTGDVRRQALRELRRVVPR